MQAGDGLFCREPPRVRWKSAGAFGKATAWRLSECSRPDMRRKKCKAATQLCVLKQRKAVTQLCMPKQT